MIINRIILKNIRSHSYLDLSFPKSRILLSGDIGAGKSSILYGIEFALFGILKGWNDGETLLKNNSSSGSVKLYFEIDSKKIIIERNLKRTPKGISQGEVHFEFEGLVERVVPTEARSRILELLNYPQEFLTKNPVLFRYTVYTPQEKMREILSDDSDIRMNLLRKLFGLDKYQLIRENSQLVSSNLRSQISYLEGQTRGSAELENNYNELLIESKKLDSDREKYTLKLENTKEQYNTVRKDFTELEKIFIENTHNVNQLRTLKDTVERITQENMNVIDENKSFDEKERSMIENIIDKTQKLDIDEKEVSSIKEILRNKRSESVSEKTKLKNIRDKELEKLSLIQNEFNTIKNERSILDERIKNNKQTIQDYKSKNIDSKKTLDEYENKISSLPKRTIEESVKELDTIRKSYYEKKENIALSNQKIENEKTDYDNITKLNLCPVCKQIVSDEHKNNTIADIEKKIKDLEEERKRSIELTASLKKRMEELEKEHALIEEKKNILTRTEIIRKDIEEASNRIVLIEEMVRREAKEISEKEKIIEIKNNEVDSTKEIIKGYEDTIIKIEKNITSIDDLRSMIETYENYNNKKMLNEQKLTFNNKLVDESKQKIESLRILISENDEKLKDFEIIREKLNAKQDEYENMLKEKTRADANYQQAINRIKELDENKKKMLILKKSKDEFALLKLFFDNTVQDVTKNIELEKSRSIHYHMESQLSKWFNLLIPDLEVSLNDNFSPSVLQSGFQISFHNLSGGERTSLSLAYRLALNDTVNHAMLRKHSGLLVLDEPTDGLSSEQMDQVRILLEQVSCEQMIIVSHEQKVESFVDDIIRITKNVNE